MLSCLIIPLTGRVEASSRDVPVKLNHLLTALCLTGAGLWATPPLLPKTMPASTLDFQQQATVPDLQRAYITSSPVDLKDGLPVGRLEVPGRAQAIEALRQADAKGQFANLDSLLIWKDGKLVLSLIHISEPTRPY